MLFNAPLRGAVFVAAGFILVLMPKDIFAYTDQITVKSEEAWQAVQDVLKNQIKTIDHNAKTLETKWVQDTIKRSRGPFKAYTSKTVDRRYQLKIKLVQRPYDTEIEIRGVFQERPHELEYHQLSWQKIHPEMADFDIERRVFMQILNRLELSRKGEPVAS